MNAAFSFTNYVIKRSNPLGWHGKYCVYDPQGQPVLYVRHKTHVKAPYVTYGVFADPGHMQPVLSVQDADDAEFANYLEVIDLAGGEKVGGIGGDWTNWFEDAWAVTDAQGATVALVRESSTRRAILHELTEGMVKQKIDIVAGDQTLATLRQKNALIGHHLVVDFSMDATGRLDRRLGLVAAIMVATHQSEKMT